MDGNGRWASQGGLPRIAGHRQGATLKALLRCCKAWGIPTLSTSRNFIRLCGLTRGAIANSAVCLLPSPFWLDDEKALASQVVLRMGNSFEPELYF